MSKERSLMQERIDLGKDFKYIMKSLRTLHRFKSGHIFLTEEQVEELVLDVEFGMEDIVSTVQDHINIVLEPKESVLKKEQPPQTATIQAELVWAEAQEENQ